MRGGIRERHQIQKALTDHKGSPTIQDWYQLQSYRNLAFQPWWNDFSGLMGDRWIELIVTTEEDSASSLSFEGRLPITLHLSKLLIDTIIIDFLVHGSAFSPTSLAEFISAVSF
ncbi:hypothetical protein H0E87_005089 [Populus deltoides]|uniref:Uncharacterized protein n=1 Tax=Populus deltoides TaxID=3696 RepID=A0A8T2ZI70_POPDE|nr:hypothetical protein H0E87_005089 [Populus deltoides]